jgi:hypothetical protein
LDGFTEWHFVNIVLPALLPVAIVVVVWFFPLPATHRNLANPWIAVRDGQLAWAALGMCTAAFHEFRHPAPGMPVSRSWETAYFWLLLFSTLWSGFGAAFGPIFPTGRMAPTGLLPKLAHYRVFVASLVMTSFAGWLYATVHLTTQRA